MNIPSTVRVVLGPHGPTWRRVNQPLPGPYCLPVMTFDGNRAEEVNGIEFVDRLIDAYGGQMDREEAMAVSVRIMNEVELAKKLNGDSWGYYPDQHTSSL